MAACARRTAAGARTVVVETGYQERTGLFQLYILDTGVGMTLAEMREFGTLGHAASESAKMAATRALGGAREGADPRAPCAASLALYGAGMKQAIMSLAGPDGVITLRTRHESERGVERQMRIDLPLAKQADALHDIDGADSVAALDWSSYPCFEDTAVAEDDEPAEGDQQTPTLLGGWPCGSEITITNCLPGLAGLCSPAGVAIDGDGSDGEGEAISGGQLSLLETLSAAYRAFALPPAPPLGSVPLPPRHDWGAAGAGTTATAAPPPPPVSAVELVLGSGPSAARVSACGGDVLSRLEATARGAALHLRLCLEPRGGCRSVAHLVVRYHPCVVVPAALQGDAGGEGPQGEPEETLPDSLRNAAPPGRALLLRCGRALMGRGAMASTPCGALGAGAWRRDAAAEVAAAGAHDLQLAFHRTSACLHVDASFIPCSAKDDLHPACPLRRARGGCERLRLPLTRPAPRPALHR